MKVSSWSFNFDMSWGIFCFVHEYLLISYVVLKNFWPFLYCHLVHRITDCWWLLVSIRPQCQHFRVVGNLIIFQQAMVIANFWSISVSWNQNFNLWFGTCAQERPPGNFRWHPLWYISNEASLWHNWVMLIMYIIFW